MATTSLGPETDGPLEEDDSGNLVLSDDDKRAYKEDSFDILKVGTIAPTPSTLILGVVDVGAIFNDFGLNITPSPDLARTLEADPDRITVFDATFAEFLGGTATFLNFSIDDPVGKQFGIIDPTIIIAKVKTAINDFVKKIVSLVSDALLEAKEDLGEKFDELLEMINFEFPPDPTIQEIFEKITEILAAFALLAAGAIRKGLKKLFEIFGIPWIGDIIDTIMEVVQAIRAFINNVADLGRRVVKRIKEALYNIVQAIKNEIKEAVINAVLAAIEALLSIPLPQLPPPIPAWIIELPERARELFNITIVPFDWPQFLLMPPNILTEIYQFILKLVEWLATIPSLDFITAILEALAEGVVGLIKFLVGIIVEILALVFNIGAGMFLKIAGLLAFVVRIVKYLAITLIGVIVGDGMIFRSVKATILAGSPEVIQDEPETATA
jgi:phage-related protein